MFRNFSAEVFAQILREPRLVARSIDIVEYKVRQTHFFLQKLEESDFNLFAVQCYTDAFAASARSITLAIQAVAGKLDGFEMWYERVQNQLREEEIARSCDSLAK